MFCGLGRDFLVFHMFVNWLWVRQFQWCQSALLHLPLLEEFAKAPGESSVAILRSSYADSMIDL